MEIRPARKEDIDKLADIFVAAYNPLNIGEEWTKETAIVMLAHLFEIQPDLTFVAIIDNEIVGGTNAIVKPWWDGNHITDGEIFVESGHQGQKIGKKLLKRLFQEAKNKYSAVSWDTFTHVVHEHPLTWYKSMGFEEIPHWTMITGDIDKVLQNLTAEGI
ncbi:GNAT family N-acetyltransferase [Candidatus Woesebacteria bacterium]|nr:GNAT family N-acetyltransferase [Candidatus Woesebacteria bacterium]